MPHLVPVAPIVAAPAVASDTEEAQLIVVERGVSLFDAVAAAEGKRTVVVARQAAESIEGLVARIQRRHEELADQGRALTRADVFLASGHDAAWAECRTLLLGLLALPTDSRSSAKDGGNAIEVSVYATVRGGGRRAARLFASVDALLGDLKNRVSIHLRFERP